MSVDIQNLHFCICFKHKFKCEIIEIENSSVELDKESAIKLYNLYDSKSELLKKFQQRILSI